MDNVSLKKRILKAATYEFLTRGIKAVTMDGLSRKLKISKRTLYETFHDKEELMCESFVMTRMLFERYIETMTDNETNSLDLVSLFFLHKIDEANYLSPCFYRDLMHYPNVIKFITERNKELKANRDAVLKQCIDDGYFRPNIEYSIIGEMLSRQVMYLLTNNIPYTDITKALQSMLLVCIRGCCTIKGQNEFDALIKKYSVSFKPTTPAVLQKRLDEL